MATKHYESNADAGVYGVREANDMGLSKLMSLAKKNGLICIRKYGSIEVLIVADNVLGTERLTELLASLDANGKWRQRQEAMRLAAVPRVERFFKAVAEPDSDDILHNLVTLGDYAREELAKRSLPKNNSSQEGGTVQPMTTARGDVSEVKQEGLADTSSSLSRKRGQAKKETSPPQKRKIGTKRESSRL
jgi:hypothetical protein